MSQNQDTKKRVIRHTVGTAMMIAGITFMAYSVYEKGMENTQQLGK